ncbi:Uncharacterised protein [Actinobacillus pleuropneumoniae]|nr:Uncharacterised protein [Actinobacillus pleuropneumoniae]
MVGILRRTGMRERTCCRRPCTEITETRTAALWINGFRGNMPRQARISIIGGRRMCWMCWLTLISARENRCMPTEWKHSAEACTSTTAIRSPTITTMTWSGRHSRCCVRIRLPVPSGIRSRRLRCGKTSRPLGTITAGAAWRGRRISWITKTRRLTRLPPFWRRGCIFWSGTKRI